MEKEKNNYEKIIKYFDYGKAYSHKEIIKGLIQLEIAPKGKGLLSRLGQEIFFRISHGKQKGDVIAKIKFSHVSRYSNMYILRYWSNNLQ